MLRRVFSFTVIIVLLGGAIGASAIEASPAQGNMPLCCKRASSTANAPETSIARLCCKLNCSEPGSSGSNTTSNFSRNQGIALATAIIPTPAHLSSFANRNLPAQTNHAHNSYPKYLQHLALLI